MAPLTKYFKHIEASESEKREENCIYGTVYKMIFVW